MMTLRLTRRHVHATSLIALFVVVLSGCAGGTVEQPAAESTTAEEATADPGTTEAASETATEDAASDESERLIMWVRAGNEGYNRLLAEAYNETHPVQIEVVPVADAEFVPKYGAAVASGDVPDLVGLNVTLTPRFIAEGLLTDITDRVNELPFADSLLPSHVAIGTADGRLHGIPHQPDASTLYYNKDLFRQAGLDPEKPPTTWAELRDYAERIDALGEDVHGFYFAGQCTNCTLYTGLPLAWAGGAEWLKGEGNATQINSPEMKDFLQFYRDLFSDGLVPPDAQTDTGAGWLSAFASGDVGIQGLGSFAVRALREEAPDLDYGVALLPGKDGGVSSYAGGDILVIPNGAQNVDAAWEFIEWELSEETQVEIIAKDGSLVARTDLFDNPYTGDDPRVRSEEHTSNSSH